MKIEINTNCQEDEEKVMFGIKKFCRENFRECKIKVNELEEEIKWQN